jgi:hypothetical protein
VQAPVSRAADDERCPAHYDVGLLGLLGLEEYRNRIIFLFITFIFKITKIKIILYYISNKL